MKRHLLRHFVDIKMDTTYADSEFHLLGEGVSSLTEEFNAEEETQQWINEESGTTDIKSYTPSIEVERQNVDQDDTALSDWFDEMIDNLPTGKAAATSYVRVRLIGTGPSYPAVLQPCVATVGSTGGDAGGNVTDVITLGGRGDKIKGTFTVSGNTGTFTAGGASGASAYTAKSAETKATSNKSNLS